MKSLFKYILTLFTIICFKNSEAQINFKEVYKDHVKGRIVVSGGYGFPSLVRIYAKNFQQQDILGAGGIGPFIFKLEYLASKRIGISASGSYNSYYIFSKYFGSFATYLVKDFNINLRGNYYFIQKAKNHVYAGFGAGYESFNNPFSLPFYPITSVKNLVVPTYPISMELTFGNRRFIHKNIGIFGEIGIGKTILALANRGYMDSFVQLGLSYKF